MIKDRQEYYVFDDGECIDILTLTNKEKRHYEKEFPKYSLESIADYQEYELENGLKEDDEDSFM